MTPSRRSQAGVSWRRGWSRFLQGLRGLPVVTRWVLVGLAVSFVLTWILAGLLDNGWAGLQNALALTPNRVHVRPWTLLTLVLLHQGPLHLAFNGLALWSLGPHVERAMGSRKYGRLLLVSTLSGSVLYVAVGLLLHPAISAIGASGGVLGVLCAFALLFPRAELQFFLGSRMSARHLPWVIVGMDLVLRLAGMPIAVAAHLGGMLGAWALLRRPWTPQGREGIRRLLDRLR